MMNDECGMMNKTGFFEERPGVRSSMRLMSMISLIAGIVTAILCLVGQVEIRHALSLTGLFLGFAFFPKAMQKFAERAIKGGAE